MRRRRPGGGRGRGGAAPRAEGTAGAEMPRQDPDRGVSHDMVGEEAGDRARAEDTGQPGLIGPVCDAREWPPAVQV